MVATWNRALRKLLAASAASALVLLLRRWNRQQQAHARRQLVTVDSAAAAAFPIGSHAARVKAIYVYPVKSCRAQAVATCSLAPYGLKGDREFIIAESRSGLVGETWGQLTQRKCPRLSTVVARIAADGQRIEFTVGDAAAVTFTFAPVGQRSPARVKLHAAPVACESALDAADEERFEQWLALQLQIDSTKRKLRFFRIVAGGHSPELQSTPLVGKMYEQHDRMAFSDLGPLHFVSTSSLVSLNQHIGSAGEVPIERFRPNVVLEGLPAWLEDLVQEVEINGTRFRKLMDCTRCVMPTIDQQTGEAGFITSLLIAEPLATLKRIRPGSELLAWGGLGPLDAGGVGGRLSPMFGCLMGFSGELADEAKLSVGDEVTITRLSNPGQRRSWHCLW